MKPSKRVVLFVTALSFAAAGLVACLDDDCENAKCASPDDEDAGEDAGGEAASPGTDAGRDATGSDAGPSDAGLDARKPLDRDANGPGAVDDTCSFNHDCQLALRCECSGFACSCQTGTRGTAALGEPCTVGEDCASSVCVDGPGSSMLCSDECEVDLNCVDGLPICSDIAGVGRICIRTPPK